MIQHMVLFLETVEIDEDALIVNGKRVQIVNDRNPANLPWKELECRYCH